MVQIEVIHDYQTASSLPYSIDGEDGTDLLKRWVCCLTLCLNDTDVSDDPVMCVTPDMWWRSWSRPRGSMWRSCWQCSWYDDLVFSECGSEDCWWCGFVYDLSHSICLDLQGYRAEMDNPSLAPLLPTSLHNKRDVLFGNLPDIYNFHSR